MLADSRSGTRRRVEELGKWPQQRIAKHEVEDERSRLQHRPEASENKRRIDITRVVGQDENGMRQIAEFLQAMNAQPVAEGENAPDHGPEEVT